MRKNIIFGGVSLAIGFFMGYFSGVRNTEVAAAEMAEEARQHYKEQEAELVEELRIRARKTEDEARAKKKELVEEAREGKVGDLADIVTGMLANGADPEDIADVIREQRTELPPARKEVIISERLVAPVPDLIPDEVVTVMTDYQGITKRKSDEKKQEVKAMRKNRGIPEVIDYDEFELPIEERDDDVAHWSKRTLTYYGGDNVLSDENTGEKIESVDKIVGRENLRLFRDPERVIEKSGDPNIMYIKSPLVEEWLEVLHHPGNYADEVAKKRNSLE